MAKVLRALRTAGTATDRFGGSTPEQNLWRAILERNVSDALEVNLGSVTDPGRLKMVVWQAREWIGTRSFQDVCFMAGVDPDYLLEELEE